MLPQPSSLEYTLKNGLDFGVVCSLTAPLLALATDAAAKLALSAVMSWHHGASSSRGAQTEVQETAMHLSVLGRSNLDSLVAGLHWFSRSMDVDTWQMRASCSSPSFAGGVVDCFDRIECEQIGVAVCVAFESLLGSDSGYGVNKGKTDEVYRFPG